MNKKQRRILNHQRLLTTLFLSIPLLTAIGCNQYSASADSVDKTNVSQMMSSSDNQPDVKFDQNNAENKASENNQNDNNQSLKSSNDNSNNLSDSNSKGHWGTANYTLKDGVLTLGSSDDGTPGVFDSPRYFDSNEVKKIVISRPIKFNNFASQIFAYFPELTDIEGLNNIDATKLTDADGMFEYDPKLTQVDISGWRTPNLTSSSYMFSFDDSLQTININNFDMRNVTNMEGFIYHDKNLKDVIGQEKINAPKVVYMGYFFSYLPKIKRIDLPELSTPVAQQMYLDFASDDALSSLNIPKLELTGDFVNNNIINYTDEMIDKSGGVNNVPSNLRQLVFGPKMSKIDVIQTVNGNDDVTYRIDDNGKVTAVNKPINNNWFERKIKLIDSKTHKQVGPYLLAQGVKNELIPISLPDRYRVSSSNTNMVKIPDHLDLDGTQTITIDPVFNVNVQLVDGEKVIASHDYQASDGDVIDSSAILPSGYHFINSHVINADPHTPIVKLSVSDYPVSPVVPVNPHDDNQPTIDNHTNNSGEPVSPSKPVSPKQHHKTTPIKHNKRVQSKRTANSMISDSSKQYAKDANKQNQLPPTGQSDYIGAKLLGILLVICSLVMGLFVRKLNRQ